MQRPDGSQLARWAAFAIPGVVGMYAAQAGAGLSLVESLLVAALIGAVVGGAWCVIAALARRRSGS